MINFLITISLWRRNFCEIFPTALLVTGLFLGLSITELNAQDNPRTVRGKVIDETGNSVPGATVQLKGATSGTSTDDNGEYQIEVSGDNPALIVTSVGYSPQEIVVGNRQEINVSLSQESKQLDEVVVVGYGSKKKESLTGAISTVTAEDIEYVHGGSTVSSGLAGKIQGVTFRMPDGRPGASANIQIRNMGEPLYVIDGVQQDAGQFNNLAPNDIESITVLKDGSAAIYGVRAANGVVVVTTKQGRRNSGSTINVNAYLGIQNWSRFTDVLTNSYDYQRYRAEAEINRYGSTNITPQELEKWKEGTLPGYNKSFDWKSFILKKNAPISSVNVNFTGGSDKINYYVSCTRLYQNSVLGREYKFGRTNLQSNINAQVANGLKIGLSMNGRIETRDNPGVPGVGDEYWLARFAILRNTPLERPYANDNPAYLNDIKHNETNWAYLNKEKAGYYLDTWRVFQANGTVEYEIPHVKGLSLRGMYSYYIADNLYDNQEYKYDTYTYNPADDSYTRTGGSINPWRERIQRKLINVSTQAQISYNNTFGNHTVSSTVVAERISNHQLRNRIHSVPSIDALSLIYFSGADLYEDSDDQQARIGYVGRVSYSYANKYFVEASVRRDASYLFAPQNRIGYFPGFSAGWRITEEKFAKKFLGQKKILSDLKLRVSYGQLGDDGRALGLSDYSYVTGYNYNNGTAILNGQPVIGSRDRGAPTTNISWLRSTITDAGAEFILFNGKVFGSFDYFYRKRTGLRDVRTNVLVPTEIGYSLPNENLNSDVQYGAEGLLNYSSNYGKLQFTIGANLSYARTKFLQSYNPRFFNSWDQYKNSRENRYTRIDWGYICDGQFQSQEQINAWGVNIDGQGNKTLLPGDLIYKDLNGDGKIDGYDERPIGYGGWNQPNINFGLNFHLTYQDIEFHADFSGASGYTWFQNWETRWAFQNDGNLNTIFTDRWHRENIYDLNSKWISGKYPALRYNNKDHSNYNRNSTFWTHNVSYLRVRTLEIAYNLPSSILSKIKAVKKIRFYLNSYNLFSIDNVSQFNIDPEVNDDNGLQFPQNKVWNVGASVTF